MLVHIALPEGGDFRGLSELQKTSLHGGCVTQVIPQLRVSTLRKGITLVLHDADLNRWIKWTISKWIQQNAIGDLIDVKGWRPTAGRFTNGQE